jgi:hypothetical protein
MLGRPTAETFSVERSHDPRIAGFLERAERFVEHFDTHRAGLAALRRLLTTGDSDPHPPAGTLSWC